MLTNYVITRMTPEEMQLAMQWAAYEGWNPGLNDIACFYAADPKGFFAGKLNGQIIAMGSAVIYDEQFAFCGFYRVDPLYRQQGYGRELTRARMEYMGSRNAGIDGMPAFLSNYEGLGYHFAYKNARYVNQGLPANRLIAATIMPLLPEHLDVLNEYDRRHFPAMRRHFLQCWIQQPQGLALGWFLHGQLKGYGVIRACLQGFKVGPLFADTTTIAEELFTALISHAKGEAVYLDIPEINPHAIALVNHFDMKKTFETCRMYLKEPPNLPMEHIFGITSFQLG